MRTQLATTIAACLTAACSSIAPRLEAPDGNRTTTLSASEFPGASALPVGFDARQPERAWESGDEVVFALRLNKGAEVHRWLLHLRVMLGENLVRRLDDPEHPIGLWEQRTWSFTVDDRGERWSTAPNESVHSREFQTTSLLLPVTAVVRDEDGKVLTSTVVKLPVDLLGRGVLPAVQSTIQRTVVVYGAAGAPEIDEAAIRPLAEATICMIALLNVVQADDALASYFWQVVDKPSLWSVVTSLGVKATLSMPFDKSVPATKLPANLPPQDGAYVVPLRIDVNGGPALFAEVLVADAARPYALCGGMLAAVARHPTKPEITFELQLIAARLGAPQAAK